MKKHIKFYFGLKIFLILSTILIAIPFQVSAATETVYPDTINGYPVIFISTHENTVNLNIGETIITVFVKDLKLDDASIEQTHVAINKYLEDNPLLNNCQLEIYGGPGASEELFLKTHNENNEMDKKIGPIKLGHPSESETNSSVLTSTYHASFAIDKDTDAGSGLTYQSANWYSPNLSNSYNLNKYFGLLNNGWTNTGYFIQCGQTYNPNSPSHAYGKNVWSDNGVHNYVAQDFNVAYGDNHSMKFALGHLSIGWFMSCTDYTSGLYDEIDQMISSGSYLVISNSTSIFLENYNFNATPNWYTGLPSYIYVNNAARVKNGTYGAWVSESKLNLDAYGNQQTQNVITGSLTNYQTAYWYLPNVLPGAYY